MNRIKNFILIFCISFAVITAMTVPAILAVLLKKIAFLLLYIPIISTIVAVIAFVEDDAND